jgi:hypothetical protein
MTTYKITGNTNGYIANRDGRFNGKCEITLVSGLTLKEAREELLRMFNNEYETSFPNWGVVMNSKIGKDYCTRHQDGTYTFEYDSRYFMIETEE